MRVEITCINVVLPEPAIPKHIKQVGLSLSESEGCSTPVFDEVDGRIASAMLNIVCGVSVSDCTCA